MAISNRPSQLCALFEVSSVLSRSLDLAQTLHAVLDVLHQRGRLKKGMVSLLDRDSGDLTVSALHREGVVAQPSAGDALHEQNARFLEMVANLIGQAVRLAHMVNDERRALKEERDKLRRQVRGDHCFAGFIGHSHVMKLVFEQVRQVAKWSARCSCAESPAPAKSW